MISSVKLNEEEKCGEVGTGHNIDQYQTFSENIRNCIVKLNAEEKYGEVGTGHSIRDSVFCKDTQTSFTFLAINILIFIKMETHPLNTKICVQRQNSDDFQTLCEIAFCKVPTGFHVSINI